MKLTKKQIDAAVCTSGKQMFLWDGTVKGFGVRVTAKGTKRYLIKYRSGGGGRSAQQRWMNIGTHGEVPLDVARKHAMQLLAAVARGEDPQRAKMEGRQAPTLSEVWGRFADTHLVNKKPSTIKDYNAVWVNYIGPKLGRHKIRDIHRSDVEQLHKAVSQKAPFVANRMLATLSVLMNKAEAWELRDPGSNPCRYVEKNKENKRERFLSTDELMALGEAIKELVDLGMLRVDLANLFKLLLLTGARKNEIALCEWDWVDWDRKLILLPDSKTGAKPLFLSEAAMAVLTCQQEVTSDPNSAYLFPGARNGAPVVNISKPWALICEEAGLTNVRIHDLRHTAASIAASQGIALPIIGRLLGHTQAQTTARYAHIGNDPAHRAVNVIGTAVKEALG